MKDLISKIERFDAGRYFPISVWESLDEEKLENDLQECVEVLKALTLEMNEYSYMYIESVAVIEKITGQKWEELKDANSD